MIKVKSAPRPMDTSSRRLTDIVGLCLFFCGAACLLWLTMHEPAFLGTGVDYLLRLLAGSGAYAVPVIMMFVGTMFLVGFDRLSFSHSSYGSLLLFLAYTTWRHLSVAIPVGADAAWTDERVM